MQLLLTALVGISNISIEYHLMGQKLPKDYNYQIGFQQRYSLALPPSHPLDHLEILQTSLRKSLHATVYRLFRGSGAKEGEEC